MRSKWKRLDVIVAVGTLLCLGIGFYIQFFMTRPIGSGPAGPLVPVEPFRAVWSTQKVHLLGIGDSVTAGLGAKSSEHSYFNRLRVNPADEDADMKDLCLAKVIPSLTHNNFAVFGSTSQEHLAILRDRLQVQEPEVYGLVVMTTGGNDLIHSYGRRPPV